MSMHSEYLTSAWMIVLPSSSCDLALTLYSPDCLTWRGRNDGGALSVNPVSHCPAGVYLTDTPHHHPPVTSHGPMISVTASFGRGVLRQRGRKEDRIFVCGHFYQNSDRRIDHLLLAVTSTMLLRRPRRRREIYEMLEVLYA